VRLNPLAHFGNHSLRRLGKQLGERERRKSLNQGRADHRKHDWQQQPHLVGGEYVVHQIFCGGWQHQAAEPVDGHQHKSENQHSFARA